MQRWSRRRCSIDETALTQVSTLQVRSDTPLTSLKYSGNSASTRNVSVLTLPLCVCGIGVLEQQPRDPGGLSLNKP